MQIKIPALVLFAFLCNSVYAQQVRLQIVLRSAGKDSLITATIQVFSFPDTQLIETQISNNGRNIFFVKPFAKYLIRATAIGFKSEKKMIAVTDKPVSGIITLSRKNDSLQMVTITSKKPLIRQEDDKTIIDAEPLANSSTSGYEVLEKTPGAVVDQDGNVYLNSSTPAAIYINGLQMRMSNDDIVALLKSLPAGSISRIEIIRTPSAKYDASSSGGIINVVLKKGIRLGTTGSVNARYDQGIYGTPSFGMSLNEGTGKIVSYLSYQFTHRNYFDDITSNRLIDQDTLLTQQSSTKYSVVTNYVGAGVNVEVNKKLHIAYDLRITANRNSSYANSTNDFSSTFSQNEFYKSETPISNNGNSLFIGNAVSSKYALDSIGSEWTTEFDYTYSKNPNAQEYTDNYLLPLTAPTFGQGNVHAISNFIDIKTDWYQKLKNGFVLETGYKLSQSINNNDALYYIQTGNMPRQIDSFQTNTFKYNEFINSGYLQLTKLYKNITFKTGLRLEHTDISGHEIIPGDTVFVINRTDLFPYFYIKKPLFSIFGYPLVGNAIFRRSITRPTYDALNPEPKFVDPFTYNVGNPKLQPQFTTNYEINSTYNDFPVFALGTNITNNVFSPVTYQNDTTKIAFRTYDNLGKYHELYGRLFGGLPAGRKYFMYAGVQYNHIRYDGQYQDSVLHYQRGSWTFFTGHELKITPTLRFNLNAWMYVNGFRQFNELKTLGQLNLSVTKTLLDKKLSIILSGNDILRTNISKFHLEQAGILVNGTRVQDSRRVAITIRYNFGFIRQEEKKPTFTPPVETDSSN
jgi:iron complex outermembrane recepter protein